MPFSFPHASIDNDRLITSEMERAKTRNCVSDGVKRNFVGTVSNGVLTITDGACVVGGAYYDTDGGTVTVTLPASGTTVYINARYDATSRDVSIVQTTSQTLSDTTALVDVRLGKCVWAGTAWGEIVWLGETTGSNANGSFVKFADGTMICTVRKPLTLPTNNRLIPETTVNLPASFIDANYIWTASQGAEHGANTPATVIFGQGTTKAADHFSLHGFSVGGAWSHDVSVAANVIAIGRWK